EFVNRYYRVLATIITLFGVAVLGLALAGGALGESHPTLYAGLFIGLGVTYLVAAAALTLRMRSCQKKLRQQDSVDNCSAAAGQAADSRVTPLYEYRSKLTLLGLPLVHIRMRAGMERGPVKAWIAAGDAAIGVIFAFGACAIAPLSFGGLAIGLFTIGGGA